MKQIIGLMMLCLLLAACGTTGGGHTQVRTGGQVDMGVSRSIAF